MNLRSNLITILCIAIVAATLGPLHAVGATPPAITVVPCSATCVTKYDPMSVPLTDNDSIRLQVTGGTVPYAVSPTSNCASLMSVSPITLSPDHDIALIIPVSNSGNGSCQLTITDSSSPKLTATVTVNRLAMNPAVTPNPIKQAAVQQTANLIGTVGPALGAGVVLIVAASAKKGETIINNFGPTPTPSPSASPASTSRSIRNNIAQNLQNMISGHATSAWSARSVGIVLTLGQQGLVLDSRFGVLNRTSVFGDYGQFSRLNNQSCCGSLPLLIGPHIRALP